MGKEVQEQAEKLNKIAQDTEEARLNALKAESVIHESSNVSKRSSRKIIYFVIIGLLIIAAVVVIIIFLTKK